MIHRSFPLSALTLFHFPLGRALFPSPFKGEAGRGMVLFRAIQGTSRRA